MGALFSAKTTADFLFNLDASQVQFSLVICERDACFKGEAKPPIAKSGLEIWNFFGQFYKPIIDGQVFYHNKSDIMQKHRYKSIAQNISPIS